MTALRDPAATRASGLRAFCFALFATCAGPAVAALNIVACEPEWAALAKELGGDKVSASSATSAAQDPHHIEARPSLIARMRNADLVVCTGMELEAAWLPVLLRQSGNARLAPGSPNYLEAGRLVQPLDVPARLDRSQGDVHAAGNPHIHLDPRNIARIATELGARLAQLDAANAPYYQERQLSFAARWRTAIDRWQREAQPLKGLTVVAHHRNMAYLWAWLDVREIATLQPKPGIEPGAGHLAQLSARLVREPARLVVRAAYEDPRPSRWLAEHAAVRAVVLPFTVGGNEKAADLFGLFDSTIALLLEGAR